MASWMVLLLNGFVEEPDWVAPDWVAPDKSKRIWITGQMYLLSSRVVKGPDQELNPPTLG